MNRELLKQAIKKLVLQEITNNQFGTPIHTDKKDKTGEEALSSAMGKKADVKQIHGTGKTAGKDDKQEVQLSKNAEDCYDVVSVTNESERKIARGVSLEDAMEMVKKHAKDSEKTYVQKAYDKSLKGFGKKPAKEEEKEEADQMDDVDEEKQIDIADKTDAKAEEKVDKENAPIDKEVAPPMGGELVDKIEKIIDRVLKAKAEPTTSYLKQDSTKESPDKLVVKQKETPKLSEKDLKLKSFDNPHDKKK